MVFFDFDTLPSCGGMINFFFSNLALAKIFSEQNHIKIKNPIALDLIIIVLLHLGSKLTTYLSIHLWENYPYKFFAILRVGLGSTYFVKTENFLLKILYIKIKVS